LRKTRRCDVPPAWAHARQSTTGLEHRALRHNARTLAPLVRLGFGLVPLVPQKSHFLALLNR
jgi:hypothetical protein